jgi:hypothetical protein
MDDMVGRWKGDMMGAEARQIFLATRKPIKHEPILKRLKEVSFLRNFAS